MKKSNAKCCIDYKWFAVSHMLPQLTKRFKINGNDELFENQFVFSDMRFEEQRKQQGLPSDFSD